MPQRHMLPSLPRKTVIRSLKSVFKHDAEGLGDEEAHRARFVGSDGHAPVRNDVDQAGDREGDKDTAVAVQERVFWEMEKSC